MVEEIGAIGAIGSGDPGSTATLPASAAVRPLRPSGPRPDPQQAPAQPPVRPVPLQTSARQIQADLEKVNAELASSNRVMQMQVDRATGLTIVQVKNSQTGEVLQQFPSSDSVHLAQMLAAWASGKNILVDLIA
jgi:uncharacterized FlaG/YvyC family protein